MKKGFSTWLLIKDSLQNDVPVMLLYVLESSGSSPGRQGFFMAVTADGKMDGSIGGGMMEHKLVELSKERLQTRNTTPQVKKQIHDKEAAKNQSGMICSGEQTVFLYPLQQKDADAIEQILSCLQQDGSATLLLSPAGISFDDKAEALTSFKYKSDEDWQYFERLGYRQHLYIIGGGHCSLALSKLMADLHFYIHLYENRDDLHTVKMNEWAHQKTVLSSYDELASLVPSGPDNYVVIMTFGYRTDDAAIRALLLKEFAYIGVLGSKAKIQKMLDGYREEGLPESSLQNLHAPVGLPIKSETPEEIAVSIAAQIIAVKNGAKLRS